MFTLKERLLIKQLAYSHTALRLIEDLDQPDIAEIYQAKADTIQEVLELLEECEL